MDQCRQGSQKGETSRWPPGFEFPAASGVLMSAGNKRAVKGRLPSIEIVAKIDDQPLMLGRPRVKKDGDPTLIEQLKALDRAARRGILGLPLAIDKGRLAERVLQGQPLHQHEAQFVADLLTGKKRRAARPRSADGALKRDEIAQVVLYAQALHPDWKLQSIIKRIQKLHRVSRRFVFNALREVDPDRRSIMEASAKAFAKWQAEVAARATTKGKK